MKARKAISALLAVFLVLSSIPPVYGADHPLNLLIDQIGKNISGDGMDPNIIAALTRIPSSANSRAKNWVTLFNPALDTE